MVEVTEQDVAKAKIEAACAERDYWAQKRAQLAAGLKADDACYEWWGLRNVAQRLENASISRRVASEALNDAMEVMLRTAVGEKSP